MDQIQQEMGNKQAAVACAEETEEPDIEEVNPEAQSGGVKDAGAKKATEQDDTTVTEEDNPEVPQRRRKT